MGLLTLLAPSSALIKASAGPRAEDMPERIGKTWQVDPFAYMESMSHRERPSMLSYETLRNMAYRTNVISAVLQTRINQVAAFAQPAADRYSLGYTVVMRDGRAPGTRAAAMMAAQLVRDIQHCGMPGMARDSFEVFLRKFVRDSLIYDQCAAEVVPRRNGLPAFFEAVDAATIRIAAVPQEPMNEMGYKLSDLDPKTPFQQAVQQYQKEMLVQKNGEQVPAKYVQLINGTVRATYAEDELYFGIRNPRTDLAVAGYGMSELETLVGVITSYLYAEEYNRRVFQQGCLTGDTLLPTNTGLRTLYEIFEQSRAFTRQLARVGGEGPAFEPVGTIWNGQEWVPFDVVASGPQRVWRVTLEDRSTVTASLTHQFLVLRDGALTRVQCQDLLPGDVVPQSRQRLEFATVPDTGYAHPGSCGGKPITVTSAGPDLWEVIGWLIGDGTMRVRQQRATASSHRKRQTKLTWYYAKGEEGVRDRHRDTLASYGIATRETLSGGAWGRTPLYTLHADHAQFFTYLQEVLGVMEGLAPDKQVPTVLLHERSECRAAFLRGLFGADGHVKPTGRVGGAKAAYLTSTSRALLDGVQQVLWSLGIASSMEEVMRPGQYNNGLRHVLWRLRVRDAERFFTTVGFATERKVDGQRAEGYRKRADGGEVPLNLRQHIARSLLDRDPALKAFTPQERVAVRLLAAPVYADRYARGAVSRARLLEWCARLQITAWDELLSYRWVAVRSVEDTGVDALMYDVRQEHEAHQFSIGSCIVSNSLPKGLLNIKGDITDQQLAAFKREWQTLITGVTNSWKTPVLNAEDIEYVNLQPANRDMEYMQWLQFLVRIVAAVYLIDPAEINFDMPRGLDSTNPLIESSNEAKLRASKDRGLAPLVRFVQRAINDMYVYRIDPDFEFRFVGLDSRTIEQQQQIAISGVNSYRTMNEVRAMEDLPPLPSGDLPMNPTYVNLLMQQQQMALQQQQMALAAQQSPPEKSE